LKMPDWGQYTETQIFSKLRPHRGKCPECGGTRSKITFVGICGKCLDKRSNPAWRKAVQEKHITLRGVH